MKQPQSETICYAVQAIARSDALLIAAGAGMGVDSGLPDFRGSSGFWRAYPMLEKREILFSAIANPNMFFNDPAAAWGFFGHRTNLYQETTPHKGFSILKTWGQAKRYGVFVFTSNSDGQFQKAGFDPQQILECHGSINYLQCASPCCSFIWPTEPTRIEICSTSLRALGPLPRCAKCGGVARPNILMFGGDWGWLSTRRTEQEHYRRQWANLIQDKKLTIIEIGAGAVARTVRNMTEQLAKQPHVKLVRINPAAECPSPNVIAVELRAVDALSAIDNHLAGLA